jgi:hypothetical protein
VIFVKKPSRRSGRANRSEVLQTEDASIGIRNQLIPHREILRSLNERSYFPGGLVGIYRQQVLTQKTRMIRLLGRKCSAKIIHTLLGFEVQAAYKRIQCPDLVTARYLKLFSELGCHSIRLPYDPTVTAQLIPELEAAADTIISHIDELFPKDADLKNYVIRKVYAIIRQQLRGL